MRDDEVRLGHVDVDGEDARNSPVRPPDREQADEAERIEHRRFERDLPCSSVAVQLKTLIADGIATRKLRSEKTSRVDRLPGDEHVMSPDQEADHGDARASRRP